MLKNYKEKYLIKELNLKDIFLANKLDLIAIRLR